MGLDAGVYKNLRGISEKLREHVILADAETGEIDYKESSDGVPGLDRDDLYAARFRIGNLSMVVELRGEVGDRLPGKSLLMDAVLYHFAHTGDFIALGQLDELEREIKLIQTGPEPLHPYLQEFLNKMNALIDAARREQNPIVFV